MAEISLSVYQTKLDNLLARGNFNEVIAHSRYILAEYPKNIKAYSQMGQALFLASRWDEAAELFRRLLGALPNDYVAHNHLGQIYQKLALYDDAIWHTERAYDQQPNNSEIIERLRTLYKDHRGKEIQRLQLTAGAVAQQHIRNSLYSQAVNVLDKALTRYPNRIDLNVLRVRALWQAEKYLDAAESAISVLEQLPYSILANRVLTELWMMEQRPSDAQRYLSRIEDLDPYMAYRLATGEKPDESLITMEELDYDAISRRELASTNPDWLNTLGNIDDILDDEADDDLDFIDDMNVSEEVASDSPRKVTDDLENLLSDDWQDQVDALDSEVDDTDLEDLFGDLDEDITDPDQPDLDDLFASLDVDDVDDADEPDLDDLFGDLDADDFDDDLDNLFDIDDDTSEADADLDNLFDADGETDVEVSKADLDADDFDDFFSDFEEVETTPPPKSLPSTDELNLPDGMHTDDLPDGLLDRIEKMKGMSQNETMPAMNRPDFEEDNESHMSTGLTGMLRQLDEEEDLSWLTEAQQGDFDASSSPTDSLTETSSRDVESDWLEELEAIESSPDAKRASTGLTGMFDETEDTDHLESLLDEIDEEADQINPDDPNAWMQASGIEFDEDAQPENLFSIDDEESTFASADVNPMAWLGDSKEDANPTDLDPMAWLGDDVLEPETDNLANDSSDAVPNFFDDLDAEESSVEEQWLGDDDMLDEMLSLEDENIDIIPTTDQLLDGDVKPDTENIFASMDDVQTTDDESDVDDLFGDWDDDKPQTENIFDDVQIDDSEDYDESDVDDLFGDWDDDKPQTENIFDDVQIDDSDDDDDDESDVDDLFGDWDDDNNDESDDAEQPEQPDWLAGAVVAGAGIVAGAAAHELMDDESDVDDLFGDWDDDDDESSDALETTNLPDDVPEGFFDDVGDPPELLDEPDTDDLFGDWDVQTEDTTLEPDDLFEITDDAEMDLFGELEEETSSPTDSWMGDDEMLDEMLSMESDDINFDADETVNEVSTSEDWQDTMNDDLNNDWQPEQPDDELDPLAWLGGDDEDESSSAPQFFDDSENEDVDLEDMFANMSDEDDEETDEGLEWLETGQATSDDADPLAWLSDDDDTEDGEESTGMTDMLKTLEEEEDDFSFKVDSDDVEDNFLDDDEDSLSDTGSWLDRVDIDSINAEASESSTLAWEEDDASASEPEAEWLAAIDDDGEFDITDDGSEADWLADDVADSFNFEGEADSFEGEAPKMDTGDLFDFDDDTDSSNEFSFEPAASSEAGDEPDWLSAFDEVTDENDDELVEASVDDGDEADWLSDDDDFMNDDEDALEAVAEQPDWLSDVSVEGDFEAEEDDSVENTSDWLAELDDIEDADEDDGFTLEIVDEAEEPEQPDWLAGAVAAGTGAAAAMAANELMDDDNDDDDFFSDFEDNEADPLSITDELDWIDEAEDAEVGAIAESSEADGGDWLADIGNFDDEADDELEPVAEDDGSDWLADIGNFEADDEEGFEAVAEDDGDDWLAGVGGFDDDEDFEAVAQVDDDESDWLSDEDDEEVKSSVTDELDWISEGEVSDDTAVGASSESDYLETVDPATAESALDWMTDADDEDEIIFDEPIEEQPKGITDFLNGDDEEEDDFEAIAEDDGSDWLSEVGEFENVEGEALDDDDSPDWLTGVAVAGAGVVAGMAANEMMNDDDDAEDDFFSDFDDDEELDAVTEGDEPDWLSGADDFGADYQAVAETDEPAWLSGADDFDDETEDAAQADESESAWLSTTDEFQEAIVADSFDFEDDDTIVGRPDMEFDGASDLADDGEPTWLDGMEEGDGIQDAFAEDDADLDWEEDTLVGQAFDAEAPDWLDGMEEGDGIQDAFAEPNNDEFGFDDEFVEEFAENSGADDGFDAINDYETENEPVVTYDDDDMLSEFEDEIFSGAETQPSSGLSEDDYLADFEEETEFSPAESAPDWLNAMVPGLDIDYGAEEDEPVDQGFITDSQSASSDKGFGWLNDIVEEETGAMAPVVPKPQLPTAAPRFKFSNPPAWLTKLFGGAAAASNTTVTAVDEFDDDFDSAAEFDNDFDNDVDSFDDDFDLPDWLEVDDDD